MRRVRSRRERPSERDVLVGLDQDREVGLIGRGATTLAASIAATSLWPSTDASAETSILASSTSMRPGASPTAASVRSVPEIAGSVARSESRARASQPASLRQRAPPPPHDAQECSSLRTDDHRFPPR